MKKFVAMLLALCMCLFVLSACGGSGKDDAADDTAADSSAADTADDAAGDADASAAEFTTVTDGKLTMSTNAQFPPYEMVADDGSFEGIDVEVAAAIAEKLGLELQVDDMGFDAALQAAQNGKSDMVMAGVTVTVERQAVMDL